MIADGGPRPARPGGRAPTLELGPADGCEPVRRRRHAASTACATGPVALGGTLVAEPTGAGFTVRARLPISEDGTER